MASGRSVNVTARCIGLAVSVARCAMAAIAMPALRLFNSLLAPAYAPRGSAARHAAHIAVASALPPPWR